MRTVYNDACHMDVRYAPALVVVRRNRIRVKEAIL